MNAQTERILRRTLGTAVVFHTESWSDLILSGHKVHLSPREAKLFQVLAESYGEPLAIEQLYRQLGMRQEDKYLVLRYIRHLRSKLAPHGFHILEMEDYNAYLFWHHS